MIEVRNPRELLQPRRLDIAIKARFFRHLISGQDAEAETLYRWHIHARTGGREPGGAKVSIADYVNACGALLASMHERGFDARFPIRFGSNGLMRDGAHRLACGLVLALNVVVRNEERPSRARPWDAAELSAHGLPSANVMQIEAELKRLAG